MRARTRQLNSDEVSGTADGCSGDECSVEDEPADRVHARTTSSAADFAVRSWITRLVRVSALLLVAFDLTYLAADRRLVGQHFWYLLPLHLFNLGTPIALAIAVGSPAFRRHWRAIGLAAAVGILAATTRVSVISGTYTPLFLATTFIMMAAAAVLPWEWPWQLGLMLASALARLSGSFARPLDPYFIRHWLEFFAAAGIAWITFEVSRRYRAEVEERGRLVEEEHRRLLSEIARREASVAAHELAQRELRENEAKLSKFFEASVDPMWINRLVDGSCLDVSASFGYSREELLAFPSTELGIWVDGEVREEYVRRLQNDGKVRGMEVKLRGKDGTICSYLLSANLIDHGGEPYVAGFAHEITSIREAESELVAAREELAGRVVALRLTLELLQGESEQREQAVKQQSQLEARLADSQATLRRIFEASPDAIALTSIPEGRILDFNDEFSRMLGRPREELVGRLMSEFPVWVRREQLIEYIARIEDEGRVDDFEVDFRHPGGTILPYLMSGVKIEILGQPCILSTTRDVSRLKRIQEELIATREKLRAQVEALGQKQLELRAEIVEREEAERRARRNEAKFRTVVETSLDVIGIARLSDLTVIDVNSEFCRNSGYAREEALGRPLLALGIWPDEQWIQRVLNAISTQGFVRNFEMAWCDREGNSKPILINAVLADIDGERCVVGVGRDITELKRIQGELSAAREAALAASAAKSEFLTMMSHEIRTPMNAVLGMADLLAETTLSSEQRRYIDTMRANGNALLELINGILDLAKVESGRLSLQPATFDLTDLVEKVLETLAVRAHEKKLELAARVSPTLSSRLVGDAPRLRQILINLIGNAIKFTERGEVILTVNEVEKPAGSSSSNGVGDNPDTSCDPHGAERWMRFAVSDTGIGIDPDQINAIFSSFTQADSSLARKYGGSGLGLAIVRRLVALMGGEISVRSAPGEGSTFSFTVPLHAAAAAVEDDPGAIRNSRVTPATAHEAQSLRGCRVLIIDASAATRSILRELLEFWGAEVNDASDYEQGLTKFRSAQADGRPWDIILIDHRTSGGGFAAATLMHQEIRAGRGPANSQIILMITSDELNSIASQLRQSASDSGSKITYLAKPIRRSELWRAVAGVDDSSLSASEPGKSAADSMIHAAGHNGSGHAGDGAPDTLSAFDDGPPLRILLAEDSFDNRMLIEAYLKKTHCTLDFAEDGKSAVERAMTGKYDLVLMDIQMPVLDGYSAVRAIRQWEREHGLQPTPIVALTAAALDEAVNESFEAGCDAHLAKPVRKATLIEVMQRVIGEQWRPSTPRNLEVEAKEVSFEKHRES